MYVCTYLSSQTYFTTKYGMYVLFYIQNFWRDWCPVSVFPAFCLLSGVDFRDFFSAAPQLQCRVSSVEMQAQS